MTGPVIRAAGRMLRPTGLGLREGGRANFAAGPVVRSSGRGIRLGDWRHSRLRNLSETDRVRDESKVKSGFGKKIEN